MEPTALAEILPATLLRGGLFPVAVAAICMLCTEQPVPGTFHPVHPGGA